MAYTLNIENKGGYLHARVKGDNTVESVGRYLAEIREACATSESPAVVIEERLDGPTIDIFSIYDIIQQASRNLPPSLRQIAYVNLNPEDDRDALHFAETVALNRGLNVRMFTTVEDAEKWVTGNG